MTGLPRVRLGDQIANATGFVTTKFVRFFDMFAKAVEDQDAAQQALIDQLAATDAALAALIADVVAINNTQQDEIDRLSRVLAGDENFTAIQVGGQNVKPFLDKTDGDALTNTAGLGTGVVTRNAVPAEEFSRFATFFGGAATVALNGSTWVEIGECTEAIDVAAGGRVSLLGRFAPAVVSSTTAEFAVEVAFGRAGTILTPSVDTAIRSITIPPGNAAASEIAVHFYVDEPGAGSHLYSMFARHLAPSPSTEFAAAIRMTAEAVDR